MAVSDALTLPSSQVQVGAVADIPTALFSRYGTVRGLPIGRNQRYLPTLWQPRHSSIGRQEPPTSRSGLKPSLQSPVHGGPVIRKESLATAA